MSKKTVALKWDPVRAGQEIDAVWEKRQAAERKVTDYDDTLLKLLLEAKANYGGTFKEFVEKHTHISLTTAKRTLRIADGRGDEVRQQERERQQRHRGRDNLPVTPSPPTTAAEGVKLAASQGVTMTEPEVAECLRLAAMPNAEFEKHIEDTVAAEVASLVPEPVGQFPVIDFTFVGDRLSDVDRLFPGVELYDSNRTFQFDTDGIDLELYDTLERVSNKLSVIVNALGEVPMIEEAREKRRQAEYAERRAEQKAKAEAAETARIARVKWEVSHGEEARTRYRDEALAVAKENRDYEDDRGDFDQAAFDAAYPPDADGRVHYGNPEHEFFKRWCKEHHAIWPGHRDAPLPDREDARKRYDHAQREQPSINLDGIDVAEARKLLDTFPDSDDKDAVQKARLALAAFLKIKPPTPEPTTDWECDYAIDPIDGGCNERGAIHDEWKDANIEFSTAHRALEDKIWRIDNPEEAAEDDRERAKREAEKVKQLKADAKSPAKVKAKALKDAKRGAMESEMDEAKEDARENQERWSDLKDEWIEQWEADNWQPEQIAEAEAEFAERWEREHGKAFPASNYGKG